MNPIAPISSLVMGLLGSTHCVVMCGGVVGVLCAGLPVQIRARPMRQLPFTLGYNVGRIASYTMAGALAGGIGAIVGDVAPLKIGQLVLRGVSALLMVGVALHLLGLWPAFAAIERLGAPVWARVRPIAQRLLPVHTVGRAIALGALWGAMPCGLVYAALGVALGSGSATSGAITLAAFGLGTLPMLLAMGAAAGTLTRLARRPSIRRAAGALIGAMGLWGLMTVGMQISLALYGPTASGHAVHCH